MSRKYRLENLTLEAIDTYVRVSIGDRVACTQKQCPEAVEVASLLHEMQGYSPNSAQLQNCSRAARDARNNKIELAI